MKLLTKDSHLKIPVLWGNQFMNFLIRNVEIFQSNYSKVSSQERDNCIREYA